MCGEYVPVCNADVGCCMYGRCACVCVCVADVGAMCMRNVCGGVEYCGCCGCGDGGCGGKKGDCDERGVSRRCSTLYSAAASTATAWLAGRVHGVVVQMRADSAGPSPWSMLARHGATAAAAVMTARRGGAIAWIGMVTKTEALVWLRYLVAVRRVDGIGSCWAWLVWLRPGKITS